MKNDNYTYCVPPVQDVTLTSQRGRSSVPIPGFIDTSEKLGDFLRITQRVNGQGRSQSYRTTTRGAPPQCQQAGLCQSSSTWTRPSDLPTTLWYHRHRKLISSKSTHLTVVQIKLYETTSAEKWKEESNYSSEERVESTCPKVFISGSQKLVPTRLHEYTVGQS